MNMNAALLAKYITHGELLYRWHESKAVLNTAIFVFTDNTRVRSLVLNNGWEKYQIYSFEYRDWSPIFCMQFYSYAMCQYPDDISKPERLLIGQRPIFNFEYCGPDEQCQLIFKEVKPK